MKKNNLFQKFFAVPSRPGHPEAVPTNEDFPIKKILIPLIVLVVLFLICMILLAHAKMMEKQDNVRSNPGLPSTSTLPAQSGENP